MTRQMGEAKFREEQRSLLNAPHIAPITAYVESLSSQERWLPHVAPMHGGVNARMLVVLRDPGPATNVDTGSGMLSLENNDQTAATQVRLMGLAGIKPNDLVPWNAYPWYINRQPTAAELRGATNALLGLVDLLPLLTVVLLQGEQARVAWTLTLEARPALRFKRIIAIETYHPSVQALRSSDPNERDRRRQHRVTAWGVAGDILRGAAA